MSRPALVKHLPLEGRQACVCSFVCLYGNTPESGPGSQGARGGYGSHGRLLRDSGSELRKASDRSFEPTVEADNPFPVTGAQETVAETVASVPQQSVTETPTSDIMKHIESFTPAESHYCQQNTSQKYLPANLSVQKMHKLYKEQCQHGGETHVATETTYRKIFNNEFSCSFSVQSVTFAQSTKISALKRLWNRLT